MKVLLIDPFYNSGTVPPNWSLGVISENLIDNGIEVSFIDFIEPSCEGKNLDYFLLKENKFIENIGKILTNIDVVYITSSYGHPLKQKAIFPRILRICEKIKVTNKNIKISVGGNNINYAVKSLNLDLEKDLGTSFIDKYIIGDELGFVNFAFDLFGIEINSLISNTKILKWSLWDFSKYPKYLSLLTAKGCIYDCSFCFEKKIFNKKYEKIQMASVIATIKYHSEVNNIYKYAIEDSTFLSNSDIDNFCNGLSEMNKKIHWSAYARINEILLKVKKIKMLHDSGCTSLIIGIETIKDDTLYIVNKNCTSSDAINVINLLKENKIGIQGCFVLGLPGDTYKDIKSNLDYGLGLDLTTYHWHIFQPNLTDTGNIYIGGEDLLSLDYLKFQTNFPDSCIPDVLERIESPLILLMEEHFLIRAILYLSGNEEKLKGYGYNGLLFSEIFKIVKSKLLGRLETFDEEKMYNII